HTRSDRDWSSDVCSSDLYSLTHDFPVLNVEHVYHRDDAIWPFTVVGRPPQEDTCFGAIIHELTGPIIPTVVAGVHAVHAVDAAEIGRASCRERGGGGGGG